MNIFEQYLTEIKELIINNAKKLDLDNTNALKNINLFKIVLDKKNNNLLFLKIEDLNSFS